MMVEQIRRQWFDVDSILEPHQVKLWVLADDNLPRLDKMLMESINMTGVGLRDEPHPSTHVVYGWGTEFLMKDVFDDAVADLGKQVTCGSDQSGERAARHLG